MDEEELKWLEKERADFVKLLHELELKIATEKVKRQGRYYSGTSEIYAINDLKKKIKEREESIERIKKKLAQTKTDKPKNRKQIPLTLSDKEIQDINTYFSENVSIAFGKAINSWISWIIGICIILLTFFINENNSGYQTSSNFVGNIIIGLIIFSVSVALYSTVYGFFLWAMEISKVLEIYRSGRMDTLKIDAPNLKWSNWGASNNHKTDSTNAVSQMDGMNLRRFIKQRFNLVELKSIFFEMNINYDNVSGSTLDEKIIGLIDYCQRRNKMEELKRIIISNIKSQ